MKEETNYCYLSLEGNQKSICYQWSKYLIIWSFGKRFMFCNCSS